MTSFLIGAALGAYTVLMFCLALVVGETIARGGADNDLDNIRADD